MTQRPIPMVWILDPHTDANTARDAAGWLHRSELTLMVHGHLRIEEHARDAAPEPGPALLRLGVPQMFADERSELLDAAGPHAQALIDARATGDLDGQWIAMQALRDLTDAAWEHATAFELWADELAIA